MKHHDQKENYRSQWAGQFFVAAELTKRGYLVSMPFGNAKFIDLNAISPEGKQIAIDVKTQKAHGYWIISEPKIQIENMFYVLVVLGKLEHHPEYFIIPSENCNELRKNYSERILKQSGRTVKVKGFNFTGIIQYKNKWEILPK